MFSKITEFARERAKTITILGLITSAVTFVIFKSAEKVIEPHISTYIAEPVSNWVDGLTCGGAKAMERGDALTKLAQESSSTKDAQSYLGQANVHYEQAYSCGQADAGLRLAVAHCRGLGTPKDDAKARRIILDIEANHLNKAGKAQDVRRYCRFT